MVSELDLRAPGCAAISPWFLVPFGFRFFQLSLGPFGDLSWYSLRAMDQTSGAYISPSQRTIQFISIPFVE